MNFRTNNSLVISLASGVVFIALADPSPAISQARDGVYLQHDLVSDLSAGAEHKDGNLVNPWGIAFSPTGPFWISDNHTGLSTVYDTQGKAAPAANPLVVTVPPPLPGTSPAAPTGIVYNAGKGFLLAPDTPARFIFATEDGTISAWSPTVNPTHAVLKVDNSQSGAVYKGLAIGPSLMGDLLFATNFSSGFVDMFNTNFASVGSFTDPSLPLGYAPFGIRNVGGALYVTFARQDADKHDDVPGDGSGFVDVFDTSGVFQRRLISHGELNSPWGIALAPTSFGELSGTLLIGNFGDGTIHGYDPTTGAHVGQMLIPSGRPLVIDGLWDLIFGNGGQGGDGGVLYFTAGISGPDGEVEDHGDFGEIRAQHP